MSRVLVAGVGNVFFGDDGFGVEVARQMAELADVKVRDFGIRTLHLAYELLAPVELCIIADCMQLHGPPGTLYVLEPEVDNPGTPDPHAMDLSTVFAAVRQLGGRLPPVLIVGCEPEQIEPGLGLSATVRTAVPAAIEMIRDLLTTRLSVPELVTG